MDKRDEMVKTIEEYGLTAKGRGELFKHLNGDRLTNKQMILAKCYDCMGYYSDGRGQDCEIQECSLYPIMPYRKKGEGRAKKIVSEEFKQKARERMLSRKG